MNILPTYKGYTVDFRLREFRKMKSVINHNEYIQFLDFKSEKGDLLLTQMIKKDLVPQEVLTNLF